MAKRKFKTESKRILDLMVNSIYTNREIFLRELISNASDAIDKLYFKRLTEGGGLDRAEYGIDITVRPDTRELVISDNGIGMDAGELESNLGTIAKSGSFDFKGEHETPDDIEIIGQFGVGFYSAFMVAKRVTVRSRAYGSNEAHIWTSDGSDGYTLEPCDKPENGTEITLTLKDDTENESYSDYLDQYKLHELVRRYSDYIRYPIRMDMTRTKLKEGSESEYETVTENKTLNSMVPLWRKNKSEVTPEEYDEFYKTKFYDYDKPLAVIHQKTEGGATYSAIIYIPARAPFNFYSKDYEKGLQLYSSGVMITEHCAELVPDYFAFARGIVDSEDLSLNISRETLQHDRQLKVIAAALEKRIAKELADMLETDRERYERFWGVFGLQLKYGLYAEFGANSEKLKDLVMFNSAKKGGLVTLREYIDAMPAEQKYIYYAAGGKNQALDKLPAAERVLDAGYDLLLLSDDVDEFALKMLHTYAEKEFRSVADAELGLETGEQKQEAERLEKDNAPMLEKMKELLGERVHAVKISARLKSYPVCLTAEGGVSIEMEKVLSAMPGAEKISAKKILELNAEHEVFKSVLAAFERKDEDALARYTRILYNQALLTEGLPLEDPVAYGEDVFALIK